MNDIRGRHARPEGLERLRQVVRIWLRQLDRARLMWIDASYTDLGQFAIRMVIASAVVLVLIVITLITIWCS